MEKVSKASHDMKSVSSETFVSRFQLKIFDDFAFINFRLAKKGYIPFDL